MDTRRLLVLFALATVLAFPEPGWSAEVKGVAVNSKGELGGEGRAFIDDDDGRTEDFGLGMAGRVEVKAEKEAVTGQARIFGRVDVFDHNRSRVYPEELWLDFSQGDFGARVGAQLLNWTATEAFHPADVLNSRNWDSTRMENAEKIGEPMVALSYRIAKGNLTGYYLPALITPILPSGKSRLNFAPPGVNLGDPLFFERRGDQSDDHFSQQWAAVLSQSIGATDFSLQAIQHVDRTQPLTVFDGFRNEFRPAYLFVTQVGGTAVHVLGPVVLKLEGAYRMFEDPGATPWGYLDQKNHGQIAAGIEYTWAHVNGSETGFILEGQSVIRSNQAERQALAIFQNDILAGIRHAFNDEMAREILATAIVDVERSEEMLFHVSYQQRLSDTWKIEGGLRVVHAPQKSFTPIGLERLDQADQIFMNLIRYF